jgi:5-hydroxyisourate hydrolase
MIGISTHVLDTARGEPARGVRVVLEHADDAGVWSTAGEGVTDSNGRIAQLLSAPAEAGAYRLTFFTGEYFEGQPHFHPQVVVHFLVHDPAAHYHVPLLLSPYGYTTYRGS